MDTLLPIGEYEYDKDKYSFDEAWENLERSFQKGEFIVCFAVNQSEDEKYINLDYHNIRGKIFRGYLTQNRKLHNEYFVGKSFCVSIYKLDKRQRTFVATHIPVEAEGKRQISLLERGDKISGIISYIDNEGSYAFVDVKEGLSFYISARNLLWRPMGFCKINRYYSVGERIEGVIIFLEPIEKPQHSTVGAITCLDFEHKWAPECKDLKIGGIVEGIPTCELLLQNMYFIPYAQHVYIEFRSDEDLSEQKAVKVVITEILEEEHLVKAALADSSERQEAYNIPYEEPEDKGINNDGREEKKTEKTGSLFDLDIKAVVSPFSLREDEEKAFESTPNETPNFASIKRSIKMGHIHKLHFDILKVINILIFCTSKQIMAFLFNNGELPPKFNQNKLNLRLETMSKLGLVDRIRFRSSEGEGIYRVYFLNKNGEALLRGYLGIKRTSYQEALLATPINEIKRYLATNQIVLAYKEKFDFLQSFYMRRFLWCDPDTLIKVSCVMTFSNSIFLLETRRRFPGWKEELAEKIRRYDFLFENYQNGILPANTQFLLNKQMYFLIVCEDMLHALEIRDLLWGHTIYPYLFFTHDLLVFQTDVNYSIFRFEGLEQEAVYYNVTDLLCYNMYRVQPELDNEQKGYAEEVEEFWQCLKRGYGFGLEYLQKHKESLQGQIDDKDLQELYRMDENGNYDSVYPQEEQYYIYLLFLINHKFVSDIVPEFHQEEAKPAVEYIESENKQETDDVTKPTPPAELELAVERVLQKIYNWCMENMNRFQSAAAPFQGLKRPIRQSSGMQFGYDVGMDFKYHGKSYHLGFECKNYSHLLNKTNAGKAARLNIERYAYNLLQFFMFSEEDVINIWILVNPFGNLQNDIYEKLFEKWNRTVSSVKLRAFCSSQTDITCEEFLSLDEEAYRNIYQHEPPEMPMEEKKQLFERVFNFIIDNEQWKEPINGILSEYPMESESFDIQEQMALKTIQGENVLDKVFEKLRNNQNVFLIGEYGSGKTVMADNIVRTVCKHQEINPYFPMLFKLSEHSLELESKNVEEAARKFIEKNLKKYDDIKINKHLRKLVILDGLDEIVSGLGESELKILFLEHIYKNFLVKCGVHTLFVITSREIDFNSCMKSEQGESFFHKFSQIFIGDCQKEEAIQKLKLVEEQIERDVDEKSFSVTENSRLMNIAQKPLYFGYVRDFILNHIQLQQNVDEIDILEEIVKKSVQRYIKNDSLLKEEEVNKRLRDWARAISVQMTDGEGSEIVVYAWNILSGEKNNVIRLRKINENQYGLRFYHNAIREYLVAKELYQMVKDCIVENAGLSRRIEERLQLFELTPEMIGFFVQLVKKNNQLKDSIKACIVKLLQSAKGEAKQRLGTNMFSILYHLQNEISNIDLHGIYANNLYLWNCSLKNVNLANAKMKNLRLFNVMMERVDVRGANLSGLVMGNDDKILDVQTCMKGSGFSVYVLYENQKLAEFCFSQSDGLGDYEIIYHGDKMGRTCSGFCLLENDILFYSDREVFFESNPERVHQMSEECRLMKVTPFFILIEQDKHLKLVMHSFKYQEIHLMPLLPNEKNMLCILDYKGYLYVEEGRLYFKQGKRKSFITYLNSECECFAAIRVMESNQVKVYVKYSNHIQMLSFSLEGKGDSNFTWKLPQYVAFSQMKVVKESLLYGICNQTVYLVNLLDTDVQVQALRISVKCRDLVLEDPDAANRVQGETEYELLRMANDCSEENEI